MGGARRSLTGETVALAELFGERRRERLTTRVTARVG
jgi:hypothetical protein